MNSKLSPKERGLIKGALRRVFARSDLHREMVQASIMQGYVDAARPRVKKWSICSACAQPVPTYLCDLDHNLPVVPLTKSLEEMSCDELIDRLWCDKMGLRIICRPCHKEKSRAENKIRREFKKEKLKNETKESGQHVGERRKQKENKASAASKRKVYRNARSKGKSKTHKNRRACKL